MANDPVLDRVILQLTPQDKIDFRMLTSGGCLTLGGLGAGKTSTVGTMAARSFLQGGYGGLILCVKGDEPEHWKKLIHEAKREADLVEFGPGSPLSFDALAYIAATGNSGALTESIAEFFNNLLAVGKVYQPSSGERYFEEAVAELVRAVVVLLINAGEPVSIVSIHGVICSLPAEPEQIDSEDWQRSSECARIIFRLRENRGSFSPEKMV